MTKQHSYIFRPYLIRGRIIKKILLRFWMKLRIYRIYFAQIEHLSSLSITNKYSCIVRSYSIRCQIQGQKHSFMFFLFFFIEIPYLMSLFFSNFVRKFIIDDDSTIFSNFRGVSHEVQDLGVKAFFYVWNKISNESILLKFCAQVHCQ